MQLLNTEHWTQYLEMLKARGLQVGPVRVWAFENQGIGMVASRNLQPGMVLGIIPRTLCIQAPDFQTLVAILAKKVKNKQCLQLFMPVRGGFDSIREQQIEKMAHRRLSLAYSKYCQLKREALERLGLQAEWAWDFCISRSYDLCGQSLIIPFADLFNSTDFGQYQAELQLFQKDVPEGAIEMVLQQPDLTKLNQRFNRPFLAELIKQCHQDRSYQRLQEILNEKSKLHNQQSVEQSEDQGVRFQQSFNILVVCCCRIQEGEQVYMSYGQYDNLRLLEHYGYAVLDNQFQRVWVTVEESQLVFAEDGQGYPLALRTFNLQLLAQLDENQVEAVRLLRQKLPILLSPQIESANKWLQVYSTTRRNIIRRQLECCQYLMGEIAESVELVVACRNAMHISISDRPSI